MEDTESRAIAFRISSSVSASEHTIRWRILKVPTARSARKVYTASEHTIRWRILKGQQVAAVGVEAVASKLTIRWRILKVGHLAMTVADLSSFKANDPMEDTERAKRGHTDTA